MKANLYLWLILMVCLAACSGNSNHTITNTELDRSETNDVGQRLLEAASSSNHSVVQELLASLKFEDIDRALVVVMSRRHEYKFKASEDVQLVKSLLTKGADPNATDDEGEPIVFLARSVGLLRAFGDDPRMELNAQVTTYGATLLTSAIGARNADRVQYLLEKGLDPNRAGKSSMGEIQIPIHMAIQYDDEGQIVKQLINHPDMDWNQRNDENRTPLEWAKHLAKTEVIQLIQARNKSSMGRE